MHVGSRRACLSEYRVHVRSEAEVELLKSNRLGYMLSPLDSKHIDLSYEETYVTSRVKSLNAQLPSVQAAPSDSTLDILGLQCSCRDTVHADHVRLRAQVFHDLWQQGYYVSSASKFGGDYLIYPRNPVKCHAEAIVIVKLAFTPFRVLDIVSMGRMAAMVKKKLLLATQRTQDGEVEYLELDHILLVNSQES